MTLSVADIATPLKQDAEPLPALSQRLNRVIQARNTAALNKTMAKDAKRMSDAPLPLTQVGGALAVHCQLDLAKRSVVDVAAMASVFRGYEAMLPSHSLSQVGRVSSTASGICGGVHATASALCLEMALDIQPPPLGVVLRNLLLSCQYLNDNTLHVFVLAGPDYSQECVQATNPELWQKAQQALCPNHKTHGFRYIADIMRALNKGQGSLYREAMQKVSVARQAYICLGGQYPHSESIVPGGVCLDIRSDKLSEFQRLIAPFAEYSLRTAAIWDDVFDFFYQANPLYLDLGRGLPSLLDFGQWDHPEYYDASYQHCDVWGNKRWSSPGAIIKGKLACTQLSLLNAGLEESFDYSYQRLHSAEATTKDSTHTPLRQYDPLGNPISPLHPWNKRMQATPAANPKAYSWGSSLSWRGHGFEVGAYSRLYLTAVANNAPSCRYLSATGHSLEFDYHDNGRAFAFSWQVPKIWNSFERNRARANALAFNYSVTQENVDIAKALLLKGETQTQSLRDANEEQASGSSQLGVGLWGASRGFLAHWAVLSDNKIDNYQIAIPSRVNAGTRTSLGEAGPLEKALLATPILETGFNTEADFTGIDFQRVIQSFDPCMSCTAHYLFEDSETVLDKVIETG